MVNKFLLKGKIIAAGYTQKDIANMMDMSLNSLNSKINGTRPFDTDEVSRLCDILSIREAAEKCDIFLASKSH